MKEIMLLYSHCIVVKGALRATINDLQRGQTFLIPNSFANLFEDGRYFRVAALQEKLDPESKEILSGYLDFLQQKELAFTCTEEELPCFPKLNDAFLFAGHISNAVFDARERMDYFNHSLLRQLDELGCRFIQLRFYQECSLTHLEELLGYIDHYGIQSVDIIMPARACSGFEPAVLDLITRYTRISCITLYGAGVNEVLKNGHQGMSFIVKQAQALNDATHCGLIHSSLFSVNIPTYTESLHYNSCLNRKISIDTSGNIRNCPSMQGSYGNIKDTTLRQALQHPDFKKYWTISKDQIAVCRDCEFRYTCTDCRAYLEEPDNDRSKPLKCGYDPYTVTWQDWSRVPGKQQAIQYYGIL